MFAFRKDTDISENMIRYANKTFSDEKQFQFDILDIELKIYF